MEETTTNGNGGTRYFVGVGCDMLVACCLDKDIATQYHIGDQERHVASSETTVDGDAREYLRKLSALTGCDNPMAAEVGEKEALEMLRLYHTIKWLETEASAISSKVRTLEGEFRGHALAAFGGKRFDAEGFLGRLSRPTGNG